MTTRAEKVLGTISKLQFLVEWFLNSQNSKGVDNFMSALVVIEGVKFYYKMQCLFASPGIYLENPIPQQEEKNQHQITQPQEVPATMDHLQQLLQKLKTKSYLSKHNEGMTQVLPSGKTISLQSLTPIPKQLGLKKVCYSQIVGELLHLFRPFIYIIVLKIYGTNSYKPWVIALVLDVIRWLIQSKMPVRNVYQMSELSQRKRDMISKALFRPPFYSKVFKPRIIEPILNRLMSCDRWIYKIIMYILEMRSSITLTI